MKEYSTGISRTALTATLIAIVIGSGLVIAAMWASQTNPSVTTTPTTTTTTTGSGYGALTAHYINSRRDDVVFMWSCNNSLVNEQLTDYYRTNHSNAYVDGLYMIRNTSGYFADLLFAPYYANLTGSGKMAQDDWEAISGALVDDGIGKMPDATTHPTEPNFASVNFSIDIYFNDNTFLSIYSFNDSNLVWIANGTWTGGLTEFGWPDITSFDYEHAIWLLENDLLNSAKTLIYDTVTSVVSYPAK